MKLELKGNLENNINDNKFERYFKAIVNTMPDKMFRINKDGDIFYLDLSQNNNDFVKYAESSLNSHWNVSNIKKMPLSPPVISEMLQRLKDAFETQELQTVTYKFSNETGTYVYETRLMACCEDEALAIERDITDISSYITSLKQSEARYRSLVENASDFIFQISIDNIITYITPNFYDYTGYKAYEILNKSFSALIHSEDLSNLELFFKSIINDSVRISGDISYRMKMKDNTYRWFRATGNPIFDEDGAPVGVVGITHDITEQKSAEEKLLDSQKLFWSIFDTVNAGIALADENGTIVQVNKAFTKMFGYYENEAIGAHFTKFIKPDKRNLAQDQYHILLELGDNETHEYDLVHKSGRIVSAMVSFGLITLENGAKFTVSAMTDITERKQSEDYLKLMNIILKTNLETTPYGSLIMNKEGEIVTINKRMIEMFNIPREVVLSNNYEMLVDYVASLSAKNSSVINMKQFVLLKRRDIIQNEFILKDGRVFSRYISPMIGTNGDYYGAVIFLKNITDQKKFEEALKSAKESAEEATRLKSEFLANMSHEIRTPMNAILGFAQLLSDTLKDDKQLHYVRSIINSGKNLLSLINDILDLSKIESGKLDLVPIPTNIYILINELQNAFSVDIQAKNLEFKIEIDPFIPPGLLLDEIRLRQVLTNLVSNAIKFTDEGYIKISLTANFKNREKSDMDLLFSIEDTGIGIPESQQEVIFESFRQQSGQSSRRYGGTGLGLAITKKLIETMDGYISLKSKVGVGSVFSFKLFDIPAVQIQFEIDRQAKTSESLEQITFENQTVLIAEPNDLLLDILTGYLDGKNINIVSAHDCEEFLEKAFLHKPDVIILDFKLNSFNEYATITEIKEHPDTKDIPIILLTSDIKKPDKDVAFFGYNSYIQKPALKSDVIAELTKYLTFTRKMMPATAIETDDSEPLMHYFDEELYDKLNQIDESESLISLLRNELFVEWQRVNSSLILNDIKQFALNMVTIGEQYGAVPVSTYGKVLFREINSFEFELFPKTLADYPKLIQSFTKKIQEGNN